jgi:hypothetical protein
VKDPAFDGPPRGKARPTEGYLRFDRRTVESPQPGPPAGKLCSGLTPWSVLRGAARVLSGRETRTPVQLPPHFRITGRTVVVRAFACWLGRTVAAPSKDEIVNLSPFEVTASNRGYYGSNAMSGTRLNSRVEDLASSVIVVTKEQMADFAMLDLNDNEVSTEGIGNYTDLTFNAAQMGNGENRTKLPQCLTRGFRNTFTRRDIIPVVKRSELSSEIILKWSGRQDSNLRPPGPKPGALPG